MKRINFIFQICRSSTAKQKWYWRCKAQNGEIRCHSENYVGKGGAYNAVKSFTKAMKPGTFRIEGYNKRPKT